MGSDTLLLNSVKKLEVDSPAILVEVFRRFDLRDSEFQEGVNELSKLTTSAVAKDSWVGPEFQFDRGFGDELPYPEASFDRVFSSFMFHHLPAEEKGSTLREVRRVFKSGREFYMMDFEGPHGLHGQLARVLHAKKDSGRQCRGSRP